MKFRIFFHGPFHIFTGEGANGIDHVIDRGHLVEASGLKGVMRHQARVVLGFNPGWIDEVYGSRSTPCPWHFGSPVYESPPEIQVRHRIAIDDVYDVTKTGALVTEELCWAETADFEIVPMRNLETFRLRRDKTVLLSAAQSVTSIGASRNRGYGWVTIVCVDDRAIADRSEECRS